ADADNGRRAPDGISDGNSTERAWRRSEIMRREDELLTCKPRTERRDPRASKPVTVDQIDAPSKSADGEHGPQVVKRMRPRGDRDRECGSVGVWEYGSLGVR